jgi:hypothetical protein
MVTFNNVFTLKHLSNKFRCMFSYIPVVLIYFRWTIQDWKSTYQGLLFTGTLIQPSYLQHHSLTWPIINIQTNLFFILKLPLVSMWVVIIKYSPWHKQNNGKLLLSFIILYDSHTSKGKNEYARTVTWLIIINYKRNKYWHRYETLGGNVDEQISAHRMRWEENTENIFKASVWGQQCVE